MKSIFQLIAFTFLLLVGCTNKPTHSGELAGHEYVDLALPSGNLWATCNLGSDDPNENGNFFAWGETDLKYYFEWDSYQWSDSLMSLTKYCLHESQGVVDNRATLEASDDAAAVRWGATWHIPSKEEWQELIDGCEWRWVRNYDGRGMYAKMGTSKRNGNTIVFPYTGYYSGDSFFSGDGCFWSSSLCEEDNTKAYYMCVEVNHVGCRPFLRKMALTVRAVADR